jgi:parallel beta-helix repeat protein
MRRALLCAVVAAAALLAFAQPALAEHKLIVDDDLAQCPEADYTSIQAAVMAAPAGSTVFVCEGTYEEEVLIATPAKNGLRLIGDGPDKVVIDGNGALNNGIELMDVRRVLVEGFTVRAYHDDIVLTNADRSTVRKNVTTAAFGHDGIILQTGSDGNLIEENISHDNLAAISCGISIGAGSSRNVVRDNVTHGNPNFGILVGFPPALGGPAGPGNVVQDNESWGNGRGIGNNNSPDTRIRENLVRNNTSHGILVFGGTGSTGVIVEENTVVANGSTTEDDGIRLQDGASDNEVRGNESVRNTHDGIHLVDAHRNLVEKNRLLDNGTPGAGNGCGIDVDTGSSGNTVRNNEAIGHSRAGFRLRNAAGNVLRNNEAEENPGQGILLTNGDNNTVGGNESEDNGVDGISVDSASEGNTIARNEMDANAEFDCRDDSVGGGTAGTANLWINNEGDTENRPGLCDGGEDEDAEDD